MTHFTGTSVEGTSGSFAPSAAFLNRPWRCLVKPAEISGWVGALFVTIVSLGFACLPMAWMVRAAKALEALPKLAP